jgi:hypothetical protein
MGVPLISQKRAGWQFSATEGWKSRRLDPESGRAKTKNRNASPSALRLLGQIARCLVLSQLRRCAMRCRGAHRPGGAPAGGLIRERKVKRTWLAAQSALTYQLDCLRERRDCLPGGDGRAYFDSDIKLPFHPAPNPDQSIEDKACPEDQAQVRRGMDIHLTPSASFAGP